MFESNFPVDSVSISYAILWNAFKMIASNYDIRRAARVARRNGSPRLPIEQARAASSASARARQLVKDSY